MTPEREIAELEADAGFHEYGIRAALTDYAERFGAQRLVEALNRSLLPFKIEASHVASRRADFPRTVQASH
ncbi:MAG: hypothetical protein ACLP7P_08480 [Rhodomicrobium sp.]